MEYGQDAKMPRDQKKGCVSTLCLSVGVRMRNWSKVTRQNRGKTRAFGVGDQSGMDLDDVVSLDEYEGAHADVDPRKRQAMGKKNCWMITGLTVRRMMDTIQMEYAEEDGWSWVGNLCRIVGVERTMVYVGEIGRGAGGARGELELILKTIRNQKEKEKKRKKKKK